MQDMVNNPPHYKQGGVECIEADRKQVGGNHYTKLAIQPMRYSLENGLNAAQHTVIKYVTRYKDKGGLEDLLKAKHTIDLLIEFEGKENAKN